MATNRIVLFYGFAPVTDPQAVMMWQRELGERWELRGRVIISEHGINATLGGTVQNLKRYVKTTRQYPGFKDIDVKWSDGTGEDFPRLSVKVREELVAFGAPGEVEVRLDGVVGGGEHLAPEQLHELVENRGEDVVFFDGRNAFEAQTGKFKDAVVPDVSTTHGFLDELNSGKYDHLKDKAVVTYCTGGVRCEILTVLMKNRGFKDVYQLDGGIVRYGEKFGSKGLWEGSLYVFDARGEVKFDADSESIGHCLGCGETTARFANCSDDACTTQRLMCETCETSGAHDVPTTCATCESLRPAAIHS